MIAIGSNNIKARYIGNTEITKVYQGSNLIWQSVDYESLPMTLEALEDSTVMRVYFNNTLTDTEDSRYNINSLDIDVYVDDNTTPTRVNISKGTNVLATINAGHKIKPILVQGNLIFDINFSIRLLPSKRSNVYGNLMSWRNYPNTMIEGFAINLFYGSQIESAENLILPTQTSLNCYRGMFAYSNITKQPKLRANNIADYAYYQMFNSTSSLEKAEDVIADTFGEYSMMYMYQRSGVREMGRVYARNGYLPNNCCNSMFSTTSKLEIVKDLDTPTAGYMCYKNMFLNSGISIQPKVNLVNANSSEFCMNMFRGTNITKAYIPQLDSAYVNCFASMYKDCTKLISVENEIPFTNTAVACFYEMFQGCTSLATAPALPSTLLYRMCYFQMFDGCTSLTAAPELPAETLVSQCYHEMFNGCVNLNYIKAMFITTPSDSYTSNWVNGVASSGTFVKNVDATWSVSGANGIPEGWTVETCAEDD